VINQLPLKLYQFGPFRLSLNDRLLYSGDQVVPLTPKLVDTLIVLVENNGRVVTKDVLMESVWPDSFVEESSLSQNISLLRKALANMDCSQYIETIPKRGYRFIASVRELGFGNGIQESNQTTIIREQTSTELLIDGHIIGDTGEMIGPGTSLTAQPVYTKRHSAGRVYLALALCFVSVWGVAIYLLNRDRSNSQLLIPKSIAVLPFKTIDAQADGDVIGLGMANAVILGLSSLKHTTVLPTSSVFQYAKRDKDATLIGRELGVDAVLDGTVQRVTIKFASLLY